MSGHSQPPPPPSRFPTTSSESSGQKNDLGSLCPPPLQTSPYFHHPSNHQQLIHNYQNPAAYQAYQQIPGYSYSNLHYQQVQQPGHRGYYAHQNHQTDYYYPNHASAPPPPPPPPRDPAINSTNTENGLMDDTGTSETQSANRATQGDKPKKVNPKMAQKYSGQGLKTITISGPGIKTQKFKICVGNHPEDIKKWIAERKKNFPRTSSLQKGSISKSKRQEEVTNRDEDKTISKRKEEGEIAAPLSSLLAGYGSSSSMSDEESTSNNELVTVEKSAAATKETIEKQPPLQPKRICKYYQRGKCHHGDSCKFLHSDKPASTTDIDQRKRKRQAQSDRDKARKEHEQELQVLGLANPSRYNNIGGKTITNTSLLHKLLQRDKERERRLTLQLLRYIVDSDYFQSGKKSEEDQA